MFIFKFLYVFFHNVFELAGGCKTMQLGDVL